MSKLETRIPPVGVFLLFAAAMWLTGRITPEYAFNTVFRNVSIGLLLAASAVFGLSSLASFRRAGTTVNPFDPQGSTVLVSCGVYRYSRNPMYLALFLALLALGFLLSNFYAFALALLFVPYINRFQIHPEERAMAQLFGAAFDDYCAKVRRWI